MLEYLKNHIDFSALKKEFKKIGVNFFTAGIVGVFIYHCVGTNPVSMLLASAIIGAIGLTFLYLGVKKTRD